MTIELNLSPSPVLATTPTMMPAAAHVAATLSICAEPSLSAVSTLRQPHRRIASQKLTAKVTTVAQNTESTGEKPNSMNATIAISDRKWYQ